VTAPHAKTPHQALYQEVVLLHGNAPRNEGPLDGATHEATKKNPLCGDRVTVRLRVEGGVVRAVRFEARGCMIARASASMMTEAVTGRRVEEALALVATLDALVTGAAPPLDAGVLEPLRGVRDFPARRGCVTLAFRALAEAVATGRGSDEAAG
jgi:nitrogen fixation protein NifU and related proteins